jgi:hypothetical protein
MERHRTLKGREYDAWVLDGIQVGKHWRLAAHLAVQYRVDVTADRLGPEWP